MKKTDQYLLKIFDELNPIQQEVVKTLLMFFVAYIVFVVIIEPFFWLMVLFFDWLGVIRVIG